MCWYVLHVVARMSRGGGSDDGEEEGDDDGGRTKESSRADGRAVGLYVGRADVEPKKSA